MTDTQLPSPLVYPLNDNERLIELIASVMEKPASWIRDLLYQEELNLGQYHRSEFREWGIEPFVWCDRLEEYYRNTDSSISGQPSWNRRPEKLKIRHWIGNHLKQSTSRAQEILTIGDGAGFDSLYLSKCGHNVTFSEQGRLNIKLAKKIFELNQAPINIAMEIQSLAPESFDAVVCLDVLEHVLDPPQLVAMISRLLRPGGRLIVHAPFFFVSPLNPTHLRSNIKYSGSISRLYGKHGFELVDGRLFWDPIALVKTVRGKSIPRRHAWLCVLRAAGLLLAFARVSRLPHLWVAKRAMQKGDEKWLKGLEPTSTDQFA